MKKHSKFALKRETVRRLNPNQLANIVGGVSFTGLCPASAVGACQVTFQATCGCTRGC